MSPSPRAIGVIVNPHSRKNRHDRGRRARLERIVGRHGVVRETDDLAALSGAVSELLEEGVRYLVSDGGDGALHWLMNELEARRPSTDSHLRPAVLPTNGGTIDFVARKVGVRGRAEGILTRLTDLVAREQAPAIVEVDTLSVDGVRAGPSGDGDGDGAGGSDGAEGDGGERAGDAFHHVGFAVAAGGVGNRFFDRYYAEPDPSASSIPRIVARTLASLGAARLALPVGERRLAYGREMLAPLAARVTIDGDPLDATSVSALHAGAIDIQLGGLVRLFPLAREPGRLHLQAGDVAPRDIVRALPAIYRGLPIRAPGLRDVAGSTMTVDALGPEDLAPVIDGERFQGLRHLQIALGPRVGVVRIRA